MRAASGGQTAATFLSQTALQITEANPQMSDLNLITQALLLYRQPPELDF